MASTAALVYFGGGTLLFFFWVYGIYAFVRDCRRRYVPALRELLAARRQRDEEREREQEREEQERHLY